MARIGLVLGAGGTVGQAYHAGVLAALEHDLGWDPRTADLIVGTSAGSISGTLLRLGVPAPELAAWAVAAPLSLDGDPLERWLSRDRPEFPPFTFRHWLRPWRLPSLALLSRIARKPWAIRPSVAAMTLMPPGRTDLTAHTVIPPEVTDDEWPDGLWICAARRKDGRRTVFGRTGSPPSMLGTAVAASCAIPGYFRPVRIDGIEYIDGGIVSPTNMDVLSGTELDLVLVIAPLASARGAGRTLDAPIRYAARRRLHREVARLGSPTPEVVSFEPGTRVLEAMGLNMMASDRSDRVVQAAFIEAGGYASSADIAPRLDPLVEREPAARRRSG